MVSHFSRQYHIANVLKKNSTVAQHSFPVIGVGLVNSVAMHALEYHFNKRHNMVDGQSTTRQLGVPLISGLQRMRTKRSQHKSASKQLAYIHIHYTLPLQ